MKLEKYNIKRVANNLIKRFLENRIQTFCINNELSNKISLNYGVPQETVLGSLLLIILYMIYK